MAKVSTTVLKSFFEKGDRSTQDQFGSLIDSTLHFSEDRDILGLRVYDPDRVYLQGDSVIFNLAIFECTALQTTGTFNPNDWREIAGGIDGAVVFKGTWDASTNTPDLASSSPEKGWYYVVSVSGNTDLDGITDWKVGDWAIYNGSKWEKVDNTDQVSTAENVGSSGVGVFKEKLGTVLQFRSLRSPNNSLFITPTKDQDHIAFDIAFGDSGSSPDLAWSAQKISNELFGKTDKVSSAAENNFASFNTVGNIKDSGLNSASFLPSNTVASDIPVTPSGGIQATEVQAALVELDDEKINLTASGANENIQSTSNSSTYVTALRLSFTPPETGIYLAQWYMEVSTDVDGVWNQTRITITPDGGRATVIGNCTSVPVSPKQYCSESGMSFSSLNGGLAHEINVGFKKMNGADADLALIRRVRVVVTKLKG